MAVLLCLPSEPVQNLQCCSVVHCEMVTRRLRFSVGFGDMVVEVVLCCGGLMLGCDRFLDVEIVDAMALCDTMCGAEMRKMFSRICNVVCIL